ncbi:MAG: hypothetical protein U1E15_11055 [Hyphomicrobiales bacterium]
MPDGDAVAPAQAADAVAAPAVALKPGTMVKVGKVLVPIPRLKPAAP